MRLVDQREILSEQFGAELGCMKQFKTRQGQRDLNDRHPETVSSNRDIPEAER